MAGQMFSRGGFLAAVLAFALMAGTAAAQSITQTDIQRLQDSIYRVSSDIGRMSGRDSTLNSQLRSDLDDVSDEVVYLKVKLRRTGLVTRSEFDEVRNRIESIRSRANGGAGGSGGTSSGSGTYDRGNTGTYDRGSSGTYGTGTSGGTGTYGSGTYSRDRVNDPNTVPSGQELDVRLQTPLSSETAQVEDRFEGTTVVDLYNGDRLLVPAGSVLNGIVTSVDKASRTDRKGSLTLSFDRITVRGRSYPMRATVAQVLEAGGWKEEAGRIGTGGAVGAIIGGILGGAKGALLGVLIGAGGTIAATEGKDVDLDAGTVVRVRLEEALTVR